MTIYNLIENRPEIENTLLRYTSYTAAVVVKFFYLSGATTVAVNFVQTHLNTAAAVCGDLYADSCSLSNSLLVKNLGIAKYVVKDLNYFLRHLFHRVSRSSAIDNVYVSCYTCIVLI